MDTRLSILIVDDDLTMARRLGNALQEAEPRLSSRVVPGAAGVEPHLSAGSSTVIDFLLVNLYLQPDQDIPCTTLIERLARLGVPLVAFTAWWSALVARGAVQAGAWTVFDPTMDPGVMTDVLDVLHEEYDDAPDAPVQFMPSHMRRAVRTVAAIGWTQTELEALRLRDRKLSRTAIAQHLHLTPKGVDRRYERSRRRLVDYFRTKPLRVVPTEIRDFHDHRVTIKVTTEVARRIRAFIRQRPGRVTS